MRKVYILGLITFFLFVSLAISQPLEKIIPNQVTLGWDAVTQLGNGNPIPTEDTIKYEVFTTAHPIDEAKRHDPTAHTSMGETIDTQMVVTFTAEGNYLLGVRTVRLVGGDPSKTVYSGEISWSDTNGVITPEPFYVAFFLPPAAPQGLNLK